MIATMWSGLAEDVAAELRNRSEADIVVLWYSDRFVKFVQLQDGIYADTISNEFLPAGRRLGPHEERRLADLGWFPPDPVNSRFNWWCNVPWPLRSVQGRGLARLLLRTLHDVHGVREPHRITYSAFNALTKDLLSMRAFSGLQRADWDPRTAL
jgi:hypothetical protein